MNTFVVIREIDSVSFGEPIYAGPDREFALTFSKVGKYVVFEFDSKGTYLNTHRI